MLKEKEEWDLAKSFINDLGRHLMMSESFTIEYENEDIFLLNWNTNVKSINQL